jgi:5-methylcytosine-specific restriction endonuclease McrBC regulatory subunit McrC
MPKGRPDDIVCFEIGSGDAPAWVGSRRVLGDDWRAIEMQAHRGVIQLEVRGDLVTIRGLTRVGLVVLPSGRRLIVRSKIPSLALLEWLAYLGEFPRLTAWLPDAGVAVGDDWHQCLASLFLYALEYITRQHVRKDYVAVASDEPEIRGRILTTALGRRLHRLPRVPQIQRRRTLDTPSNMILALALDRLPALLADGRAADRWRLARLREQWASIRRDVNDPVAAVTAAQWASPPGYRETLQLARLILIGAVLDPVSNMGGQAFTLPLAIVWERALRRMFDELAGQTGWRRVADSQRTRRWNDPAGRDDPKRWLTADVIAQRSDMRWVLDAKYKREFGDESRVDRFQMCAYAVAFDADRVSLVYPTGTNAVAARDLLSTTIGGKRLLIDSLALPMAAGPEACSAALASMADGPFKLKNTPFFV